MSVPVSALAPKPADVTFVEVAAVPTSGLIALQGVRGQGRVGPGQRVLINGVGGDVGTFAVQLAKSSGAEVTAVDSAGKLDMLRSIGADEVIDYTVEDFTRTEERYDVIVDIPGSHAISAVRRALTPRAPTSSSAMNGSAPRAVAGSGASAASSSSSSCHRS